MELFITFVREYDIFTFHSCKLQIKLYEATRPLKIQIDSLLQRLELLTGDFHDKEQELDSEKQVCCQFKAVMIYYVI